MGEETDFGLIYCCATKIKEVHRWTEGEMIKWYI